VTDTLDERADKLLELNGLLETKPVSRETFLKGSGALVVGVSLVGGAAAATAGGREGVDGPARLKPTTSAPLPFRNVFRVNVVMPSPSMPS